ncbi:MAG: hypothetical protein ACTS10_21845 [Kiloniellales bacterium]
MNFTRVLEVPLSEQVGRHDFCHAGGYHYPAKLVDWFDASTLDGYDDDRSQWLEAIANFVAGKKYVQPGKHYVVIFDTGEIIGITPSNTEGK